MSARELVEQLLQSVADLAVIGGWEAEEVLHRLRNALADSGAKLELSRDESAERLGVSRRTLSSWSYNTLSDRTALDVVLAIRSGVDVKVDAKRNGGREFVVDAQELLKLGVIRHPWALTPQTHLLLERATASAREAARALENTRAQPKLGSRVVSESGDPTQSQPGQVQSNREPAESKNSLTERA